MHQHEWHEPIELVNAKEVEAFTKEMTQYDNIIYEEVLQRIEARRRAFILPLSS